MAGGGKASTTRQKRFCGHITPPPPAWGRPAEKIQRLCINRIVTVSHPYQQNCHCGSSFSTGLSLYLILINWIVAYTSSLSTGLSLSVILINRLATNYHPFLQDCHCALYSGMSLCLILINRIVTFFHPYQQDCHFLSSLSTGLSLCLILINRIVTLSHPYQQDCHCASSLSTGLPMCLMIKNVTLSHPY